MAKFIGRDTLLEQVEKAVNKTSFEVKGLIGEIEVGDLLAEHLPGDTYVIAKPVIGKYEPDFLVISPRYGFRLIEVKNWSIKNIRDMQSNGAFLVMDKLVNPLQQVIKHFDNLKGYLISNYPSLGDLHKMIGYVVIQYGFSRLDIEKYSQKWESRTYKDFFRCHFFKDDLGSDLDARLASASKFNAIRLNMEVIKDIVRKIRVSDKLLSDSAMEVLLKSEELNRAADELKELNKIAKQIIDEQRISSDPALNASFGDKYQHSNKVKNLGPIVIFTFLLLIAILIGFVVHLGQGVTLKEGTQFKNYSTSFLEEAFVDQDNFVRVNAKVIKFEFDEESGTKFLELEAENFVFPAVIFKDVRSPFIDIGKTYKFYGVTQKHNGNVELKINQIRELN